MGFIISPFLSPFLFGFLIANARCDLHSLGDRTANPVAALSWRWAYGIATIYGALILGLITFFGQETSVPMPFYSAAVTLSHNQRMYDRAVKPIPVRPAPSLRYRAETLLGITGMRMAKHRLSLTSAFLEPIKVVWRPQILGILIFEAALFGFSIGINVNFTQMLILGTMLTVRGTGHACRLSGNPYSSRWFWVVTNRNCRRLRHADGKRLNPTYRAKVKPLIQ